MGTVDLTIWRLRRALDVLPEDVRDEIVRMLAEKWPEEMASLRPAN